MNKITIIAIRYHEPDYAETVKCIEATGLPVHYVERNPKGVGSLAETINRGVREAPESTYFWIVTNVTFDKEMPTELLKAFNTENVIEVDSWADGHSVAAVHPFFNSDHEHLRFSVRANNYGYSIIPFVEFTAPMVRAAIMKQFPLDESMPYWGHDLDFGYRVRKEGYLLVCDNGIELGHTYIRHKPRGNSYTRVRQQRRRATDASTQFALQSKYGEMWKELRWPKKQSNG